MTPSTSRPLTPPYLGKLPDLDIARLWLESVSGELHFAATPDAKNGEFYMYTREPEPGGKTRCRIKYLADAHIEARLLAFIILLCEQGASVRVTPSKVRSIKVLAAWLMLAEQGGGAK